MGLSSRGWSRVLLAGCCVLSWSVIACSCKGALENAKSKVSGSDAKEAAQEEPGSDAKAQPVSERATPTTPAQLCTPSEARCIGLEQAETCNAKGEAWTATACSPGQACVGGTCAGYAGSGVQREDLLALAGEGWINAWGVARSVPRGLHKDAAATPDAIKSLDWDTVCTPEPLLEVVEPVKRRRKKTEYAVAATVLVSPRAQRIWLKASARGDARIFVGGRQALEIQYDSWRTPMTDARLVQVDLKEGRNEVVVWLAQEDKHPGVFQLRAHSLDGGPAAVWGAPIAGTCAARDLVSVQLDQEAVPGGFHLTPRVRFLGLRPASLSSLSLSATIEGAGTTRLAAKGSLDLAKPRVTGFVAKMPSAGPYTVAIDLGAAGKRSFPLRYHGQLHERITTLAAATRSWKRPVNVYPGSASSWLNDINVLLEALEHNETDAKWLASRVEVAEEVAAEHQAGRDGYAERSGVVHRAYRSELDGQLQPYAMFVPPSYEGEGELPLVVVAHGLNNVPEHALRAVVGFPRRGGQTRLEVARYMPDIRDQGALVVAPWGFGDNGQRLLGEADVLAVIRDVQRHYQVDPRRITLTGYSLGGTVAFTLPVHYPDLLAYSAPLCGYPNLYGYREVKRVKNRKSWEKVMLAKRYLVNYAENGRTTPMWVIHGGRDQPQRVEEFVDAYDRYGKVNFDLQEDLGHNVWDYAYDSGQMVDHLKKRRRVGTPTEIRFTTAEYRYNRSFWVTVTGIADYTDFARVNARWDKSSNHITLKLSNVSAISLNTGALDMPGAVTVDVNGSTVEVPAGTRAAALEDRGGWRLSSAARTGGKRPGVAGPIDDAQIHKSLIVYGTRAPAETESNRLTAQWHAQLNPRTAVNYPVKADVDVTAEDLRTHTIILVGRPEANSVAAKAAAQLPVSFDARGVTVRGKRHDGPSVGVSLIFPSPWSDKEYVVLHAGTDIAATLASRNLPEMVPDYLVYDGDAMSVQVGETLLHRREVRDGGFFDEAWK
jgi:poly(3-hydroxybutyrate) depolymerase